MLAYLKKCPFETRLKMKRIRIPQPAKQVSHTFFPNNKMQVLYGLYRYSRLLEALLSAFYHHHSGTAQRQDANMYAVFAYLALFRLHELSFPQFRRLVRSQDAQKILVFVKFLFSVQNLENFCKDAWLKVPLVALLFWRTELMKSSSRVLILRGPFISPPPFQTYDREMVDSLIQGVAGWHRDGNELISSLEEKVGRRDVKHRQQARKPSHRYLRAIYELHIHTN